MKSKILIIFVMFIILISNIFAITNLKVSSINNKEIIFKIENYNDQAYIFYINSSNFSVYPNKLNIDSMDSGYFSLKIPRELNKLFKINISLKYDGKIQYYPFVFNYSELKKRITNKKQEYDFNVDILYDKINNISCIGNNNFKIIIKNNTIINKSKLNIVLFINNKKILEKDYNSLEVKNNKIKINLSFNANLNERNNLTLIINYKKDNKLKVFKLRSRIRSRECFNLNAKLFSKALNKQNISCKDTFNDIYVNITDLNKELIYKKINNKTYISFKPKKITLNLYALNKNLFSSKTKLIKNLTFDLITNKTIIIKDIKLNTSKLIIKLTYKNFSIIKELDFKLKNYNYCFGFKLMNNVLDIKNDSVLFLVPVDFYGRSFNYPQKLKLLINVNNKKEFMDLTVDNKIKIINIKLDQSKFNNDVIQKVDLCLYKDNKENCINMFYSKINLSFLNSLNRFLFDLGLPFFVYPLILILVVLLIILIIILFLIFLFKLLYKFIKGLYLKHRINKSRRITYEIYEIQ